MMSKTEILEQLVKNYKHMQLMEEVMQLCEHDPFLIEIGREYHEIRAENGELVAEYRAIRQFETAIPF